MFEVRLTFNKRFPYCLIDEDGATVALFADRSRALAVCFFFNPKSEV